MSRLRLFFDEQIVPKLREQLGVTNIHALPRVSKVVISMGLGKAIGERKRMDEAISHLSMISGQKPLVTKSRKAVSAFRLREGMDVGCMVTLRGQRMYEFIDRLINLALPRVRDFRGLNPNGFDGRGNYSMGLNEQLVFPEVNADTAAYTQGMNIAVVTTAGSDDVGRILLGHFGFPFRKDR